MGLHHRPIVACQRHVHVTVPGVPGSDLRGQGRRMLPIVECEETVSIHRLEQRVDSYYYYYYYYLFWSSLE